MSIHPRAKELPAAQRPLRVSHPAAPTSFPLLFAALLCISALIGCPGRSSSPDETHPVAEALGEDPTPFAPEFTLPDLQGRPISLRSLRGRTVLLDFWATWCAPCIAQVPVLNEVHDSHPDRELLVLGVSVDGDAHAEVAEFAKKYDLRYRVLLGSPGLARRYGAFGLPALAVVDRDGRLRSLHDGLADRAEMQRALLDAGVESRLRTSP